jgi:hypothetical protein
MSNNIEQITNFSYHLEEGILNPETVKTAEQIVLEKLSHIEGFNYIEVTSVHIDFMTHSHESQKFAFKILIKGNKDLVFDDLEKGNDFLEVVRAGSEKAVKFLQKENNKRGSH